MKNKTIFILLLMLSISSCNISAIEELEDSTIAIAEIPEFPLKMIFKFCNSITNQQLEHEIITIVFEGEGGENGIIDSDGKKWLDYQISTGLLELYYDPNMMPSKENPIKFTLTGRCKNYAIIDQQIELTETKTYNIDIKAIPN